MDTTVVGSAYISPKEVAAELNVSLRTVRRLLEDGSLKGYAIGTRLIRIARSDLDIFLKEREIQAKEKTPMPGKFVYHKGDKLV